MSCFIAAANSLKWLMWPTQRHGSTGRPRNALPLRGPTCTTQNLSIYTTLDLHLQALAPRALERGLDDVQELVK